MSADRCEPAEADRGRDGVHWIALGDKQFPAQWRADHQEWRIVGDDMWWPVETMTAEGYAYIAPVPSPAAVAGLAKAARDALDIIRELERDDNQYYSERARLEIAIEAFPQPKDTAP